MSQPADNSQAITPVVSLQEIAHVNQQQAYSPTPRDLDFLSYLASPVLDMPELSEPEPEASTPAPDTRLPDAPKKKTTESKTQTLDPAPPVVSAGIRYQQETDDTKDTISLDLSQLQLHDVTALQALPNAANMQHFVLQNLSPSLLETMPQLHYTSLNVSAGLQDALENAYKTQRPIRISLADNADMILHLGRDGRVSAEFLPNDRAAEAFFRQHILDLKNRLDEKELPYNSLSVRNWQDQQQKQQQKQQNEDS